MIKLLIIADLVEDSSSWIEFTKENGFDLEVVFVYKDENFSYNYRRIKRDNAILLIPEIRSTYFERLALAMSDTFPVMIYNSRLTFKLAGDIDFELSSSTLASEDVSVLRYKGNIYGVKTNGTYFKVTKSANVPTLLTKGRDDYLSAVRVFNPNFLMINWDILGNTPASTLLFKEVLKLYKGLKHEG